MRSVINLPVLSTILAVVGMITVIVLNLKKKTRKGLSASKLSFGCNRKYYLILPLIILGILILESVILYLTGFGLPLDDFNIYEFLGGYKGVLVLGIIWGIWHYPMNAMGYNFPGQPILGNALMTVFTIIFGIILSYAVLKDREYLDSCNNASDQQ